MALLFGYAIWSPGLRNAGVIATRAEEDETTETQVPNA